MSTAPTLYRNLPFDPLEAFETVGLVTTVPMTIVARPDFEPDTLQELIDYVKANKDTVTYANAGIGAACTCAACCSWTRSTPSSPPCLTRAPVRL